MHSICHYRAAPASLPDARELAGRCGVGGAAIAYSEIHMRDARSGGAAHGMARLGLRDDVERLDQA